MKKMMLSILVGVGIICGHPHKIWKNQISPLSTDDDEFALYLNKNNNHTVFIDAILDMSLGTIENIDNSKCIGYIDRLLGDSLAGGFHEHPIESNELEIMDRWRFNKYLSLPLDCSKSGNHIRFLFLKDKDPEEITGGTGVLQYPISGYFKISKKVIPAYGAAKNSKSQGPTLFILKQVVAKP